MKKIRILIDMLMTIFFFFFLGYFITGNKVHDILGTITFVLFIIHNIFFILAYIFVGGIVMDRNIEEIVTSNHEVKIMDRRQIYLTGVKKISSFDNEEFLLETTMGVLLLKGEGLEILRLDTHDGNVRIKGKINSFTYLEGKEKVKEESMFAKLFK